MTVWQARDVAQGRWLGGLSVRAVFGFASAFNSFLGSPEQSARNMGKHAHRQRKRRKKTDKDREREREGTSCLWL